MFGNNVTNRINRQYSTGSTWIVSIVSGKGGVGKSVIAFNLAERMVSLGTRVLLVDGDYGSGNLHILANVTGEKNINQLIYDNRSLNESLSILANNFHLLAAPSAGMDADLLNAENSAYFMERIRNEAGEYDIVLIDHRSGIAESIEMMATTSDVNLLIVVPELTSLANAYGLYKKLIADGDTSKFFLLPNRVSGSQEAEYISENFNSITRKYLAHSISCPGFIPEDDIFRHAVACQMPVAQVDRQSSAISSLSALAQKLIRQMKESCEVNKNTTEDGIKKTPAVADIRR